MFKAYKEPIKSEWTDNLLRKGIPLAGTVIGGAIGAAAGGGAGVGPGMQIGSGIGNLVGGMVTEDPNSEAKVAKGIESGLKGYQEWRQLPPEKKLDTNEKGKIPSTTTVETPVKIPSVAPASTGDFGQIAGALTGAASDLVGKDDQMYKSMRAPRFARF